MAHHKWSEIKRKRKTMDTVVWTGENAEEVEEFATTHGFGFAIGSPIFCDKAHDHDDWNDPCDEDSSVLEVYTADWFDTDNDQEATWTHANVGDTILANGSVRRTSADTRKPTFDNPDS